MNKVSGVRHECSSAEAVFGSGQETCGVDCSTPHDIHTLKLRLHKRLVQHGVGDLHSVALIAPQFYPPSPAELLAPDPWFAARPSGCAGA